MNEIQRSREKPCNNKWRSENQTCRNAFSPEGHPAWGPPDRGTALPVGRDCPRFSFCSGSRPRMGGPPSTRVCRPRKGAETPREYRSPRKSGCTSLQPLSETGNRGTCAKGPTVPWSTPPSPAIARASTTSRWFQGQEAPGPRRLASMKTDPPHTMSGHPD